MNSPTTNGRCLHRPYELPAYFCMAVLDSSTSTCIGSQLFQSVNPFHWAHPESTSQMPKHSRIKNSDPRGSTAQKMQILIIAADSNERQQLLMELHTLESETLRFQTAESIVAGQTSGSDRGIGAVLLAPGALTGFADDDITQARQLWPDAGLIVLSDTSDEAASLVAITLGADEVLSRQDASAPRLYRALMTSMARRRYHQASREQTVPAHPSPAPSARRESAPDNLALESAAAPLLERTVSPIAHTDRLRRISKIADEPAQTTPALETDEDYYRQLVENLPDIAFRLRLDGDMHFEYVSPAISNLTGYSAEEWIANPQLLFERIHPEDRLAITQAMLNHDVNAFDAFRFKRKDGTMIWMAQRLRVLSEPGVSPTLVEGTLRDITKRILIKAAEQEQRILAEVLRETAVLLSSTLDLDVIFDRLLANVRRVVPLDAANIMLIDSGVAHVARSVGRTGESGDVQLHDLAFEVEKLPHMRNAISSRQTQYIGDTHQDPGWMIRPEVEWIRSHMVVPICAGDDVIGLLNVDSATPGIFNEKHAGRLQVFADQAAIAVRNAQLYSAEREGHALVEALRQIATKLNSTLDLEEVFHVILELLDGVVPYDTANISLVEDGQVKIVHGRGYAPEIYLSLLATRLSIVEGSPFYAMLHTGMPVLMTDTSEIPSWHRAPHGIQDVRSYLGVPIQVNRDIIGFISLDGYTPGFFNERQIKPLQIFAEEAATAIHNAQLYSAEREGHALVEALRQIAATLNSTLDLDDVMHKILASVDTVVPSNAANIMLIDEGYTQISYWQGYAPQVVESFNHLRIPVMDTANLKQMVLTRSPMVIPDTARSPLWTTLPGILHPIRSYVSAPILIGGQVIGFVNLDSFNTQKHAERLLVFADEAAVAIQNAQLFAQVRRYADELEERVRQRTLDLHRKQEEIEAILNGSTDSILLVSPSGFVQHSNTAARHLLNRCSGTDIPITDLVAPAQRNLLSEALAVVIKDKQPQRLEIDAWVEGDTPVQADLALSPVIAPDGQVSRVVFSFRDITLRKQMEMHLHQTLQRETELNEAMSRLVTVSSHELRTSLALMQASIDLLMKYGDRLTVEEQAEEMEQMHNGITRMTHLVSDVLTFHQFGSSRQKIASNAFDLSDLTQTLIDSTSQALDHLRQFELDDEQGSISMCSDEHLVQQILESLLTNAIKFSTADTPIRVSLSATEDDVTISIRDEGIGIPLAEQRQVFDVFYRASNAVAYEGTGVGLIVVKNLLGLLDGSIELNSDVNRGTTVTVTLPRVAGADCA